MVAIDHPPPGDHAPRRVPGPAFSLKENLMSLAWAVLALVGFALLGFLLGAALALSILLVVGSLAVVWASRKTSMGSYGGWQRSTTALEASEEEALSAVVKAAKYAHKWLEVQSCSGPCRLHSLVATSTDCTSATSSPSSSSTTTSVNSRKKEVLVLVHGTAGSSVGFGPLLDRLSQSFDVHCLDLPGFGKGVAPRDLQAADNGSVISTYCDCLKAYIEDSGASQVTLLGHSLGGFIVTKFIEVYPELVTRVLLVNTAGIYPTLGSTGAYWAVFFKLSLPQSLLRSLGGAGALLFGSLLRAFDAGAFAHFYYQLLACPRAFGDTFVGRFISLKSLRPYWTAPALNTLLGTKVPLAFIYGVNDDIMPVHQAHNLISISRAPIPLCIIKDAGHAPYFDRPDAFCEAIDVACEHACAPGWMGPGDAFFTQDLLQFRGSYSTAVMSATISKLYDALTKAMGSSDGGKVFEM